MTTAHLLTDKARELIDTYLAADDILQRESDLSPQNPVINETLRQLYEQVIAGYTPSDEAAIWKDPRIGQVRPRILEKLALAEAEMERYHGLRFSRFLHLDLIDFSRFLYWKNYEELVEQEIRAYQQSGLSTPTEKESFAFVGSGPFPLSAVLLHVKTGIPVTCLDRDSDSCTIGQALVRRLGLDHRIHFIQIDGESMDYTDTPFVWIASLVPDKEAIIRRIRKTRRGGIVALRSADGVHRLLYQSVNEQNLKAQGYHFRGKARATGITINSTLYYTV